MLFHLCDRNASSGFLPEAGARYLLPFLPALLSLVPSFSPHAELPAMLKSPLPVPLLPGLSHSAHCEPSMVPSFPSISLHPPSSTSNICHVFVRLARHQAEMCLQVSFFIKKENTHKFLFVLLTYRSFKWMSSCHAFMKEVKYARCKTAEGRQPLQPLLSILKPSSGFGVGCRAGVTWPSWDERFLVVD